MLTSSVSLTHNEWPLTERCLNRTRRHTPEPCELIVVDNGSTDEPVSRSQEQTDVKLNLLQENQEKATQKWGQHIHNLIYQQVFPTRGASTSPITISLCMIVQNEEDVLARCLDSVKDIVDEYIVVDTGSTDKTLEILKKYTDKEFHFEWVNDFAAARNYAFEQATMEYILWLDADDVLGEQDLEKLKELKRTLNKSVDSVSMEYHLSFDEAGNVTSKLRRNRLVKRTNQFRWHGAVHEYLMVGGNILNADIAVRHMSVGHEKDRNIQIYEERLTRGESFSPRDLYYFGNELFDHGRFEEAVDIYQKFLDTNQGWVEDVVAAYGKLADCYHNLTQPERSLEVALKSFLYDTPRAEVCCRMGYYFLQKSEWKKSIFWYELATNLPKPDENGGFVDNACWTWVPHVQLSVCYDRIGDIRKAYEHNEIALRYRPNKGYMLLNQSDLQGRMDVSPP